MSLHKKQKKMVKSSSQHNTMSIARQQNGHNYNYTPFGLQLWLNLGLELQENKA